MIADEALDPVDHVREAGLLSMVTVGILDFYHYNLDTHFSVAGMAPFCTNHNHSDHCTSEDLAPFLVETFLDDGLVEARPETA